jgi:uncharacterized protein YbjT (DUF2867 family)
LLADPGFAGKIVAPVRRPLSLADPRLATLPLSAPEEQVPALDVFVSCLGTTIKAAGSREGFIAVDRDLVLQLAQLAHQHGAKHAIVVTSVGASRQSGNFYLRIKGEVEDALEAMGFDRLDIVRPGLLLGARPDRRPAEALAQHFAPFFNPLLVGRLGVYRSIESSQVAHAVARLTRETAAGRFVHCYAELIAQA